MQWVNRPNLDFRGFCGTIASGSVAPGDPIVVADSGRATRVSRIVTYDGDRERAGAGDAVTLVLADDVDISRGDVLAKPDSASGSADQFSANLVWMSEKPLFPGRNYMRRSATA